MERSSQDGSKARKLFCFYFSVIEHSKFTSKARQLKTPTVTNILKSKNLCLLSFQCFRCNS